MASSSYNRYLSVDDAQSRRITNRNNYRESNFSKSYDERNRRASVASVCYSTIPRWKTCEDDDEEYDDFQYSNLPPQTESRAAAGRRSFSQLDK